MSYGRYASPLQLDLFKSHILLYYLLAIYALAFVSLFYFALPPLIIAAIGLILFVRGYRTIALHVTRKARQAILRVVWDDNDRWHIVRKNGEKVRVKLVGDTFVHPKLTILNFKVPQKRFLQAVILTRDNINQETHRRLRVRLRTSDPTELFE